MAATLSCPQALAVKHFFSQNHQNPQQNMAKSKVKPTLVRGAFLFAALSSARTTAVKWLAGPFPYSRDDQGRVPTLTAAQALAIARAGTYEGAKQRNGRVTHIREIIRESDAPDFAFWEDRACIRWHDNDVPNSPGPKERQKLLCDIWDRALLNPPPRWQKKVLA